MTAAKVLLFAIAGALAGAAHFLLLRRNVELWLGGSAIAAAGLHLGRTALTLAVLAAAALNGAPPLVACVAGVLLGRALVIRRGRRASR